MKKKSLDMNKLKDLKLWLLFFLYTVSISAFVQIVLLPYILPHLHAGNGFLNSSYDSMGFHHIAVDLVNKIRTQGWQVWELMPGGHGVAGVAAIFYFFALPDPRILIPFEAALHASAALILVNLLNLFVKNRNKAIFCALPFLVFPSNLQWTAQIHKDGFSILGVILILQSMVLLSKAENYRAKNWFFINFRSTVFCICGILLIWIVRPYTLTIIKPLVGVFFLLLFVTFLIRMFKKEIPWQKILAISLSMILIFFILSRAKTSLSSADFREGVSVPDSAEEWEWVGVEELSQLSVTTKPINSHLKQKISKPKTRKIKVKRKKEIQNCDIENNWKRLSWLPLFIESKAYSLAMARKGFRSSSPEAKSNIDHDIGFSSIKDILFYLPRVTQIVFLAPFPNQWLGDASCGANSLMRKISGFEMIITYFMLIFLPYAIWYWRRRIEIWIIFIFCIYIMLVYGLVVCNIGTLYRMRYGFITILVALGIAGFFAFLEQLAAMKRK